MSQTEDLTKTLKTIKLTMIVPAVMCLVIGVVMVFGDDPSKGWILLGTGGLIGLINMMVVRFATQKLLEEQEKQRNAKQGE